MRKIASLATRIKYGPHLPTGGGGSVRYLKAQHFSSAAELTESAGSFVDPDAGDRQNDLLREDQVILAGKGNRNVAWAYRSAAGPCIASSLFYVITVRTDVVDPRYLAIVLNTASCGRALTAFAKGATVPVIPKRELANLAVTVPTLEEQRKIIRLNDLQNRRRQLLRELTELTDALAGAHLEQLIKQAQNPKI